MSRTKQMTSGTGGWFRKIVLGLGVIAVGGVAMNAAPAMAHDSDRHDRVEVRHERVIVERDHHRVWVPARYEFRTRVDCGRTVTDRILIEPGHFIDC